MIALLAQIHIACICVTMNELLQLAVGDLTISNCLLSLTHNSDNNRPIPVPCLHACNEKSFPNVCNPNQILISGRYAKKGMHSPTLLTLSTSI